MSTGNIAFEWERQHSTNTLKLPENREHIDVFRGSTYQSQRVFIWPKAHSLTVDAVPADHVDLSTSRSITINILSGENEITGGHLSVRPASAGLRLYNVRATSMKPTNSSIHSDAKPGDFALGTVHQGGNLLISVPYDLENETTEIIIRIEVAYNTQYGQFSYSVRKTIPLRLALAVNVQDTFKADVLFSRFTICSATPVPVRVHRSQIMDNEDFEARPFPTAGSSSEVFTCLPLSLVTCIRCKGHAREAVSAMSLNRRIFLDIEYQCLDQQIEKAVKNSMTMALAPKFRKQYSHVLSQHLVKGLRSMQSREDLQTSAFMGQIVLGTFESFFWDELLQAFDPKDSTQLRRDLQGWHVVSGNESRLLYP